MARRGVCAVMRPALVKVVLSVVAFGGLAILTSPYVLGLFLESAYVGGLEEQRYFWTLSALALVGAVLSCLMLVRWLETFVAWCLYAAAIGLVIELACALVVYQTTRQSHLPRRLNAFTFHPSLVGLPTPGYRETRGGVTVSHNSSGFRGAEVGAKSPNTVRILAVGGSTTYGVQVSDQDTWPARLGEMLAPRCEVLNLGVPGHSSAEHVILTALRLSELAPDVIVFYMGWNDLRSSHLSHLRADYSNFHLLEQYGSLQVEQEYRAHSAALYLAKWLLVRLGQIDPPRRLLKDSAGASATDVDARLVAIFERNAGELAVLARSIGAEPVFVPQVLNPYFRTSEDVTWWAPYLPTKAILSVNTAFNDATKRAAERTGSPFVVDPLSAPWTADDFLDHGHLSAAGNRKFAEALSHTLGPRCAAGQPVRSAAQAPPSP